MRRPSDSAVTEMPISPRARTVSAREPTMPESAAPNFAWAAASAIAPARRTMTLAPLLLGENTGDGLFKCGREARRTLGRGLDAALHPSGASAVVIDVAADAPAQAWRVSIRLEDRRWLAADVDDALADRQAAFAQSNSRFLEHGDGHRWLLDPSRHRDVDDIEDCRHGTGANARRQAVEVLQVDADGQRADEVR